MEFLEDKGGKWAIRQVSSASFAQLFFSGTEDTPNFGFTNSVYWGRVYLQNPLNRSTTWYLELAYPNMDHIQIFVRQKDGRFLIRTAGDQLPFAKRGIIHRNFLFALTIPPRVHQEIYIRVRSEDTMQLALVLWNPKTILEKSTEEHYVSGIYFGIMLAMILYNFFLFTGVRERSYIFYVLYITSFAMFQAAYRGIGYQYLWSGSPWWEDHAMPLIIPNISFWLAWFMAFLSGHRQRFCLWAIRFCEFLSGQIFYLCLLHCSWIISLECNWAVSFAVLGSFIATIISIVLVVRGSRLRSLLPPGIRDISVRYSRIQPALVWNITIILFD